MDLQTLCLLLSGVAVAAALTGVVRNYALSHQILDLPTARSSHTEATPRGGGLAIVVSFMVLAIALHRWKLAPMPHLPSILGSSVLVAVAGFADDRWHLPARWRFLVHALAAAWAIWSIGWIPPVPLFGVAVDLGWFGVVLAGIYLIWMTNLYNFMDGIDALASIEAIIVCLAGAWLWWLATGSSHWLLPLAFAACVAGFLVWNYPPAKVFMGDVGSGFIGMVLGTFSLWAGQQAPQLFWSWFILLGCFFVDATTTLVRRVLRGDKFVEAHRSHAYQYAARRHRSHERVSMAFGLIGLVWLFPIASVVAVGRLDGASGALIAFAPLVWLAYRYKAGDRAAQEM